MKARWSLKIVIYFEKELISIFWYKYKLKCTIIGVSKHVIKKKTLRATFFYMKNQITLFNNKSLIQWKQIQLWHLRQAVIICSPISQGNFTTMKIDFWWYSVQCLFPGFNATHAYEECYQWGKPHEGCIWIRCTSLTTSCVLNYFEKQNKTKKLEQKFIFDAE